MRQQRGKCGVPHTQARGIRRAEHSADVEIREDERQSLVFSRFRFRSSGPAATITLAQSRIMRLK
jgi:hypothetical protein